MSLAVPRLPTGAVWLPRHFGIGFDPEHQLIAPAGEPLGVLVRDQCCLQLLRALIHCKVRHIQSSLWPLALAEVTEAVKCSSGGVSTVPVELVLPPGWDLAADADSRA